MDTRTLTDRLARTLGRNREETAAMLDSLREVITARCSDMDSIAVPGFGSFEPKKRMERITVHPATGKRMLIPPKIVVAFKPSALLKQKIKNAN